MLKPFGWWCKMMVQVAFATYTIHSFAVQFGSSYTHDWDSVVVYATRRLYANAIINDVQASSVNYLILFGWAIFDNCRRWKVLECWSYHTCVRMVAHRRAHMYALPVIYYAWYVGAPMCVARHGSVAVAAMTASTTTMASLKMSAALAHIFGILILYYVATTFAITIFPDEKFAAIPFNFFILTLWTVLRWIRPSWDFCCFSPFYFNSLKHTLRPRCDVSYKFT